MLITLWNKLNIAQAIALAAVVAGVVVSLIFVPPDFWDRIDWKWAFGVVLSGVGVGGSALLGPVIHPTPVRGPQSVRPSAPTMPETPSAKDEAEQ